jgi:hypothetical protein
MSIYSLNFNLLIKGGSRTLFILLKKIGDFLIKEISFLIKPMPSLISLQECLPWISIIPAPLFLTGSAS